MVGSPQFTGHDHGKPHGLKAPWKLAVRLRVRRAVVSARGCSTIQRSASW
jgi:hypothetical protein